jgi:hypothetical protein
LSAAANFNSLLEQLKPEIEALFADAECRPEGIKWERLEEATYQWGVALRSAAHAFKECFGEDKEIIRSVYYASEGPLAGEDAMDRRKARRYRQFYDELSYARQPIADIQRRFQASIADTHKMLSDHGRKVIRDYQ